MVDLAETEEEMKKRFAYLIYWDRQKRGLDGSALKDWQMACEVWEEYKRLHEMER